MLPVHMGLHGVRNWQRRDLVLVELPHNTMHSVLLHVDAVHDWLPSHPVCLVTETQRRQPLWRTRVDLVQGVRHPTNVAVGQSIKLVDKV